VVDEVGAPGLAAEQQRSIHGKASCLAILGTAPRPGPPGNGLPSPPTDSKQFLIPE
jgi:hypothetical protein